jgi:hypothetical protein
VYVAGSRDGGAHGLFDGGVELDSVDTRDVSVTWR